MLSSTPTGGRVAVPAATVAADLPRSDGQQARLHAAIGHLSPEIPWSPAART